MLPSQINVKIPESSSKLMELRLLLSNFKFNLNFWFLSKSGSEVDGALVTSCVDILSHDLNFFGIEQDVRRFPFGTPDIIVQKFIEDLEWVRRSTLIRDIDFEELLTTSATPSTSSHQKSNKSSTTLRQFLFAWILQNLKTKNMCASIQALFTEKELLQTYFTESAFLRNESYANAFIIGLSAFELNQCSLLSQIDETLYSKTIISDVNNSIQLMKHKRTNSHPNFSLSPNQLAIKEKLESNEERVEAKNIQSTTLKLKSTSNKTVFPTFRKTKSLPILLNLCLDESPDYEVNALRPRSKTMNQTLRRSLPMPIKKSSTEVCRKKNDKLRYRKSIPKSIEKTSTSLNSCSSQLSSSSNISSSTASSSSSGIREGQPRRIDLINCDDIKIWTDQSANSKSVPDSLANIPLETHTYPTLVPVKKMKNVSPINSFFSSIFGTPPTYSTWYTGDNIETEEAYPAALSSDNQEQQNSALCNSSFNSSSVFDAFLPIYGKKVQTKLKSNLFEDDIATLNCTTTSCDSPKSSQGTEERNVTHKASVPERPSSSCQSLTAFLQMAHLSRNNTDLEKENAHFRISEAIISAIEHMKWVKSQPDRNQRASETITATDYLENERRNDLKTTASSSEKVTIVDASEYIPHVELAEPCHEALSAEVVGLSLISRFNVSELPKVSELKWLVSDEDTPQQLLPMPDTSPTANPDEHVFLPMTRGTRYWAPPRPQIIFTDHPIPNRKEIIRKQNNRCAGCGMRVSAQLQSSFRYCTYFGKMHCTGCHRNQMSAIPAKILQMWDFKCYPVSVFAYRLLEQMYTFPLFHVPDLNPALYVKSKHLLEARNKRLKLKFIKDFIKACRFTSREQTYFDTIPDYITNDVDIWSMSDFVDARNESMQRSINDLIEKCENHIFHCVLCTGRGFFCEYCYREHVIYPWGNKVFRCDRCGSCFHLSCWKSMLEVCCRCQRIQNRQNKITETISNK